METLPLNNEQKEPEEEKSNVVPFRLLTGGRGPIGEDWLIKLPPRTVFLVRLRRDSWLAEQFKIVYHSPRCTLLKSDLQEGQETLAYVIRSEFCMNDLIEVQYRGKEETEDD